MLISCIKLDHALYSINYGMYNLHFFGIIIVLPVVEVTATRTRVLIGDTVTLTCSVTTGDPSYANYTWTFMSAILPEITNTLTLTISGMNDLGNYICEATNVAGSGSGTISIEQGGIIMLTNVNVNIINLLKMSLIFLNKLCSSPRSGYSTTSTYCC